MAGDDAVPLVGRQLRTDRGETGAELADLGGPNVVLPEPPISSTRGTCRLRRADDGIQSKNLDMVLGRLLMNLDRNEEAAQVFEEMLDVHGPDKWGYYDFEGFVS